MQNKFTEEISKWLQHTNSHELKTKIDELSGQNWVKEIRELSSEFSLDAQKIITNVQHFLADAIDGETLKKEFEENKDHYQKYYEKLKNETFNEAKEITESLIAYIAKVKGNTQEKLTHILISNPGIEKRMPVFMKNVLGEETPVVEEAKETVDKNEYFLSKLTDILEQNRDEEKQTEEIESHFRSTFGFGRMSWMSFYKELGLDEKYIKKIRGIQAKIIKLLIIVKRNPLDKDAKKDLDIEIQRYLDPTFKTPGEVEIQKPGVKVVGIVDLSKFPQGKKDKKIEIEKVTEEVKQAPTTDPLKETIGEKMPLDVFLWACGMDYETIAKHIGKEVPARYFSHNRNYAGPLSKRFDMHFLTIGQEKKANGDTPLINVSILVPKGVILNESEIYKVKLEPLWPRNLDSQWQTRPIRGKLIENIDIPESVSSGNTLGIWVNGDKLKELQHHFHWGGK